MAPDRAASRRAVLVRRADARRGIRVRGCSCARRSRSTISVSPDRNEGVLPSRRIPNGRALSRAELRALAPAVDEEYTGGALFHDAQLYSAERLVYAVLADAERAGATIVSYAEAVGPLRSKGSLAGVVAEDRLTGERCDVRAEDDRQRRRSGSGQCRGYAHGPGECSAANDGHRAQSHARG